MVKAENIHYRIGHKQIIDGISAEFAPGEVNMILGPNGSGKSTFLKIFSGEIRGYQGTVLYNGENIQALQKEKIACRRAVMSQQPDLSFPLMVEEVVMMGRYPHFTFNPTKRDEAVCRQVIERMNLQSFLNRNYLTLSGGEKQRVQFARVLAQIWEPPPAGNRFLFLDEPLNNLDISYQQEFLQAARELVQHNTVLVAILHDINMAVQYADKLLFLKEGRLVAHGRPKDILSEALIREVFGVFAAIISHPLSGDPLVVFA